MSQAIRVVGGIAPASLLAHVGDGTIGSAESRSSAAYHLAGNESVRDAAARAWSYLRGAWVSWRPADPTSAVGAAQTRERWLLPLLRELGYGQMPVRPSGISVDGADFPVSHAWESVPVHLLGTGVDLDRRNPGVAGAARAPQGMLQELLNRSPEHLWAILSNGLRLRLLRDSTALVGVAFIEFDLEAIFDGELYAEWLVLFQLLHVSRLEPRIDGAGEPLPCWLEMWRAEAATAGARALTRLQGGVELALEALGAGFIAHPSNGWLRDALRAGTVTRHDYQRALLRLVYRLLFTFVAEDRGILLDPAAPAAARETYAEHFSTSRLRRLSRIRRGGAHSDLWEAQALVLSALAAEGIPEIGISPIGGLFDPDSRGAVPDGAPVPGELLLGARLTNSDLLRAVEHLAWIRTPGGRTQPVDYRDLGAEELGGVYEALLELDPVIDLDARTYAGTRIAGNERKTTGSYYTPPGLVSALLDRALDPLLEEAVRDAKDAESAERALLSFTVCDPACGSGGFLVASARRIAQRLAQVRVGEDQPTPEDEHRAMRDVVSRCVYGVDINDLAAELAKVSLWLEALEPGKPLSFLDARIRVGNALFGTTPALLAGGVPDAAFKEIEGDDKKVGSALRKLNKRQTKGQGMLSLGDDTGLGDLAAKREDLLRPAGSLAEVRAQQRTWQAVLADESRARLIRQADAWCAAFVWPLSQDLAASAPTSAVVEALGADTQGLGLDATTEEVSRLAARHRFFHWHLEFPEVFAGTGAEGTEGWSGGFSLMIGNPPWERVKLQEQEFFAGRDAEIATAPTAAKRTQLIRKLETTDPVLFDDFTRARRDAEGVSHFLRLSGRYPLNGRGDVNTYAVFAELFRSLTAADGQAGVIAPTGIATDATTQYFFKDLVSTESLVALHDFENAQPLFEGVHRSYKFCLLTMSGRERRTSAASFAFFLHDPSEVGAKEFALTPEEITLLNPNTGTCPIFRSRRDAEITLGIYRRVPVLIKEGDPDGNPWGIRFMTMFHMSNDSHLFHTREELEADGWTLRGNVFEREIDGGGGGDPDAPAL